MLQTYKQYKPEYKRKRRKTKHLNYFPQFSVQTLINKKIKTIKKRKMKSNSTSVNMHLKNLNQKISLQPRIHLMCFHTTLHLPKIMFPKWVCLVSEKIIHSTYFETGYLSEKNVSKLVLCLDAAKT